MIARDRVLQALASVRDPELDESITTLGFVERVDVEAELVEVRLRLPTYFCSPNFAYLMASNSLEAVRSTVGGAADVRVKLVDHHAAADINEGIAGNRGFEGTFPGEAGGGLQALGDLFARKAFISRQEKVCRPFMRAGLGASELAALTVGDLPLTRDAQEYLERRRELAMDVSCAAPLLVTASGNPIPPESVEQHLRFARTVSVSIEGNAGFCRGLLATRYGLKRDGNRTSEGHHAEEFGTKEGMTT